MRNYVVSFEDGRVEKIAAQGLLETSYCYILFREYRRDQAWEQDIVAVFAKSEPLERPHPSTRVSNLRSISERRSPLLK